MEYSKQEVENIEGQGIYYIFFQGCSFVFVCWNEFQISSIPTYLDYSKEFR